MSRYAIVDTEGNVINIAEWDGVSKWSPPENTTLVPAEDEADAERGGTYSNGQFHRAVAPVPVATPDVTLEARLAELQAQLNELADKAMKP